MAIYINRTCPRERSEREPDLGMTMLRAAHRRLVAEREAFEPAPSTLEFMKGADALKALYGAREVLPDHIEVIKGEEGRQVSIWYYAPAGHQHLQILTSWVGRKREGVWTRKLRLDKALVELPNEVRQRLQKPRKRVKQKAV